MQNFYQHIAGTAARYRALLPQARAVQRQQLQHLLRHNTTCAVGQHYAFDSIENYETYRERVPVTTYDELRANIARMAAGEQHVLTVDAPVAFEETGGSSGGRKLVPYTENALDAFRSALLPWLDDLAAHHPAIASSKSYWAISPAARAMRTTAAGIPIGLPSDAAYFGAALAAMLPATLAVPPEVALINTMETWRDVTCAHLLACEDLALISVWSPTFLQELLAHMHTHGAHLIASIQSGAYAGLTISAQRAALVFRLLQEAPTQYQHLWPNLAVVSCWDQAASSPYAAALCSQLRTIPLQGKGLLATEGVVTLPLCDHAMPVLALESGFFEFRNADNTCVEGADVTVGDTYDVLLTTWGGLYRYDIGDRVRVHGYAGEAPLLEFVGRGGVTSDLCGEKLTEAFVLQALHPLGLTFLMLVAQHRGYVLITNADELPLTQTHTVALHADQALCANPQYAHARKLNQLAPLTARRCHQPMACWQQHALAQGRRLGDIKPPALSANPDDATLFIDAPA